MEDKGDEKLGAESIGLLNRQIWRLMNFKKRISQIHCLQTFRIRLNIYKII